MSRRGRWKSPVDMDVATRVRRDAEKGMTRVDRGGSMHLSHRPLLTPPCCSTSVVTCDAKREMNLS